MDNTAAKIFARRRRHGRTFIEHLRAEKLKSEKERLGLTLSAFAERIGKSVQTAKSYLAGRRAVPVDVVDALNVSGKRLEMDGIYAQF